MSAETWNSSFIHYTIAQYFTLYDCADILYAKTLVIFCVAVCFLLGLPLNAWLLLLLLAKSSWVSMVASDIFLMNATLIQALYCLATPMMAISAYIHIDAIVIICIFVSGLMLVGWALFQSCICVKRYVAVVHPILFLKVRTPKYLKYQMMCWAVIWLVTLGFCAFFISSNPWISLKVLAFPFILVLVINTFCSLSIMRALRRPVPGDREREKMHKMNHQALRRVQITDLLVTFNFLPYICAGFLIPQDQDKEERIPVQQVCLCYIVSYTSIVVSNIVHPLLSLSLMGKLPSQACPCMKQEQTGQQTVE